jgi:hypothetical protein
MNGQITIGKPPEPPHELLARMRVELPPEIQAIFDDARAGQDKIRQDEKYTDTAKRELVLGIEQAARELFEAAYQRVQAARQKELDREEGQVRRELLNPAPSFDIAATERERLASVVHQQHKLGLLQAEGNALTMVTLAPDISELERIFNDAAHRGNESVMAAATFRGEQLAERARRKANSPLSLNEAVTRIATDMRARLTAFRNEHPSPSERLRAITVRRRQITQELERARGHWFRVYGWTEPRPTPGRPPAA